VARSHDVYGARVAYTVTATVMISAACLAGYADGCLQNDRDARNFFYLTNPEGTAGNYRAHLRVLHGCAPGSASVARRDCWTMDGHEAAG
jgi:hypothetical protein